MKTGKYNLNTIAMGVALAMGSMSASAVTWPRHPMEESLNAIAQAERGASYPWFFDYDMAGLALVESSLSLITGRTHSAGGGCAVKTYHLHVTADEFGDGVADIDGGTGNGGMTLYDNQTSSVTLVGQSLGWQIDVWAGSGVNKVGGNVITNYEGSNQYSWKGHIFNGSASWAIIAGVSKLPLQYSEERIMDYITVDSLTDYWTFGSGLQKIIKRGFPVQEWIVLSKYLQPDGSNGYLRVKKELVAPGQMSSTRVLCRIVYEAFSNDSAQFDFDGTVNVFVPPVPVVAAP